MIYNVPWWYIKAIVPIKGSVMKFFIALLMLITTSTSMAKGRPLITLKKSNLVILDESFTQKSVAKVSLDLMSKDISLPKGERLVLFLNTPGGSIQAGVELIDLINGLSRPVDIVCMFCASMGFQTLQNATGYRFITNYGTAMSHKASGGFKGEFPGQLDSRYNYYKKRLVELDKKTVKRTKGKHTLKSYRSLYENEYWCDGQECVNQGFVDSVVNVRCDKSLLGYKDVEILTMFGVVSVVISNCPIITGVIEIKNKDNFTREQLTLIKKEIEDVRFRGTPSATGK